MTDEFDYSKLNDHQKAFLAQTTEFQKAWFDKRLTPAQKNEVMALHIGVAPEGDRPVLPKPVPEYIGSREMLDMLLRRSAWAPFDEGISLDYAIQKDPETMHFEDWIKDELKNGLLRAYAKVEGSIYQDAKIDDPTSPDVFIALMKGAEVHCHVRSVVGDNHLFPNLAQMDPAECEVWFLRSDVEELPLKAFVKGIAPTTKFGQARVDIVSTAKCESEPDAPESKTATLRESAGEQTADETAKVADHDDAPVPQLAPMPGTADISTTAGRKRKPGPRGEVEAIWLLTEPVLRGDYEHRQPNDWPDFKSMLCAANNKKPSDARVLENPPYARVKVRYVQWARANNKPLPIKAKGGRFERMD